MGFKISDQSFHVEFLKSDRKGMQVRKRPTLEWPMPTVEGRRYFAAAIRAARFKMQTELGESITPEDLATRMGIPYRSVFNWESTQYTRISEIHTLLYALPLLFTEEGKNCSLDEAWEILIGTRRPFNPFAGSLMTPEDLKYLGYHGTGSEAGAA